MEFSSRKKLLTLLVLLAISIAYYFGYRAGSEHARNGIAEASIEQPVKYRSIDDCEGSDFVSGMIPDDPNDFVTSSTLKWSHGLPSDLIKPTLATYAHMMGAKKFTLDEEERIEDVFNYAFIDLAGDDNPEVIVDYLTFSGTGGHSFTIYRRKGSNWVNIGDFFGGFFAYRPNKLYRSKNEKFDRLTVYGRRGDHYMRSILAFDSKSGSYKEIEFVDIPDELNHLAPMYCYFRAFVDYDVH